VSSQDGIIPLYSGAIVHSYINGSLTKHDLLVIKYDKDYYEYIKYISDEGICEIRYQYFSDVPLSYDDIEHRDFQITKISRLPQLLYIDGLDYHLLSQDYRKNILTDKYRDFMILDCLSYRIEVRISGDSVISVPIFRTIPTKEQVSISSGSFDMVIDFKSLNQSHSTSIIRSYDKNDISLVLDIDAVHKRTLSWISNGKVLDSVCI
jgi:hypothetical protein